MGNISVSKVLENEPLQSFNPNPGPFSSTYILELFPEALVEGVQDGHWIGLPSRPKDLCFLLTRSVSSDAK